MKLLNLYKLIRNEYSSIDNFAAVIGMAPQTLKDSLNGKRSFTICECEKIAYVLRLNGYLDDVFLPKEEENTTIEECRIIEPEEKQSTFLFEVTEKEAYLIHRIRTDRENATIAFSIMNCPYEKEDLEKCMNNSINNRYNEAEENKQRIIAMHKANNKSDKYIQNAVKTIDKNCAQMIEETKKYWIDLQAEHENSMKEWLKKQSFSKLTE